MSFTIVYAEYLRYSSRLFEFHLYWLNYLLHLYILIVSKHILDQAHITKKYDFCRHPSFVTYYTDSFYHQIINYITLVLTPAPTQYCSVLFVLHIDYRRNVTKLMLSF